MQRQNQHCLFKTAANNRKLQSGVLKTFTHKKEQKFTENINLNCSALTCPNSNATIQITNIRGKTFLIEVRIKVTFHFHFYRPGSSSWLNTFFIILLSGQFRIQQKYGFDRFPIRNPTIYLEKRQVCMTAWFLC